MIWAGHSLQSPGKAKTTVAKHRGQKRVELPSSTLKAQAQLSPDDHLDDDLVANETYALPL
jgi:hypothetical protein